MENVIKNTKHEKNSENQVDAKKAVKYFLFILAVFGAICLDPIIPSLVAVGCCVFVLFGPVQTIQAISILVLVRFFNPALVTFSTPLGILSWIVIILAAVKNVPWGLNHIMRYLAPILIFSMVAASISVFISGAVNVSLLKVFSFMIGAITILSVFHRLNPDQITNIVLWLFSLISAVVVLSIATLANPKIAYNLNGVGFQGVFNHPQTLGAFLAPITAYLFGRFVYGKRELLTAGLLPILLLMTLIVLTQARTAAVAVILSLVTTFFVVGIPSTKARIKSKGSFFMKVLIGIIIFVSLITFYKPAQDVVSGYVFKRESGNVEEALSSRSRGYSSQWNNFLKSPIFGNGFGVYPGSIPANNIQYFMGIPISAAVEKGFLPTAVLEELGIMGAFALTYLLVTILRLVIKNNDPSWICLFFACLFINLGEAVFFAVGGIGVFYWLLIGLCTVTVKAVTEKNASETHGSK